MFILHCLLFFTFRSRALPSASTGKQSEKTEPKSHHISRHCCSRRNRILFFFDWFLLPFSVSYIEFRNFYFAPTGNERAYGNFMLWRTMKSVVLWRVDGYRVSSSFSVFFLQFFPHFFHVAFGRELLGFCANSNRCTRHIHSFPSHRKCALMNPPERYNNGSDDFEINWSKMATETNTNARGIYREHASDILR